MREPVEGKKFILILFLGVALVGTVTFVGYLLTRQLDYVPPSDQTATAEAEATLGITRTPTPALTETPTPQAIAPRATPTPQPPCESVEEAQGAPQTHTTVGDCEAAISPPAPRGDAPLSFRTQ